MDLVNSRILVHAEFFRDLERTVDVLKTDVVKRKVRLDPVQLESMEKELQSYTQKVSHMNCKFFPLCALNFRLYFLVFTAAGYVWGCISSLIGLFRTSHSLIALPVA